MDPRTDTSARTVLVVEDDPDAANLLAIALRCVTTAEVEVEHATNLVQALSRLIHGGPVDLVVLDLGLPDAPEDDHRLGALATLNVVEGRPPVIVVSASMRNVTAQALAAGASAYVSKMDIVTSDGLGAAVDRVLATAA